jgi:hypothetical protein
MQLQRNVPAQKRTAIIRHIIYRDYHHGKKSRVRYRGHEKDLATLSRWLKAEGMKCQPELTATPSRKFDSMLPTFVYLVLINTALPSGISIDTISRAGRSKISDIPAVQAPDVNSLKESSITNPFIETLTKYAHSTNRVLTSQEAGAIFNEVQHMLGNRDSALHIRDEDYQWNPVVEKDIIKVRNTMNVSQRLAFSGSVNGRRQHCNLVSNMLTKW